MSLRDIRAYPFLFAIIPVVRLVAAYPGWMKPGDALVVVLAVLVACAWLYGLVLLATRHRGGRLAPLVVMAVVLAFWVYVRVATPLEHRTGISHPVLVPLWLVGTVGTIWWLMRRSALLDRLERFLSLTGGLLVAWFTLLIGIAQYHSARSVRESALARRLAEPIQVEPGAKVGPRRDIYLIVLDEYANAEVTGHLFGFDNHAFLDSLRQLGFVVPAVHSNYLHTFLSVPSLLNSLHVAGLSDELGPGSMDRTLPDYLVRHNRTVTFLESQGYRVALFPTLAWEATQHDPRADFEFQAIPGVNPTRELIRSGLRQVLIKTSLLKYVDLKVDRLVRDYVERTFAAIARTPETSGPVFAFAHVMSPHTPYVFDRNCRPPADPAAAAKHKPAAYVEQIQCVNRLVLALVTTLLRTSEMPPVILLQGDHGSKMLQFDRAGSGGRIPLAAAKERLGAFGAYYLPDQGRREFGDSVTVVNVMGNVLRFYLGAALPREPDDMYLSVHRRPLTFKRVDFRWVAAEDWSASPGARKVAHHPSQSETQGN